MIKNIIDEIKSEFALVPFIDEASGLTRAHKEVVKTSTGTTVKTYPVADQTPTECSAGKEIDCVPNSSYKSLTYFELNGSLRITQSSKPDWFEVQAPIRNVWWINTDLVKSGATIDEVMFNVLKYLPRRITGISGISTVSIDLIGAVTTPDIFSKYTYDEAARQYLMPPYKYFAFDLMVSYQINKSCFTDIEIVQVVCP